jgi:hypothetical protein
VVEEIAEALVRLLSGPEPGELPHRPQPPPVHRGIDAARVGVLARVADVALDVGARAVLLRVEGLDGLARDRLEERLALLQLVVDLVEPLVGATACFRLDRHRLEV